MRLIAIASLLFVAGCAETLSTPEEMNAWIAKHRLERSRENAERGEAYLAAGNLDAASDYLIRASADNPEDLELWQQAMDVRRRFEPSAHAERDRTAAPVGECIMRWGPVEPWTGAEPSQER